MSAKLSLEQESLWALLGAGEPFSIDGVLEIVDEQPLIFYMALW